MTKLIFTIIFLYCTTLAFPQIGIGTNSPHESSILDIQSSTKGFLPTRLNIINRNLIQSPATGLLIYCTNCCINGTISIYNGNNWENIENCKETDNDDDGIPNLIDIDDDNDGILDIDEYQNSEQTFNTSTISMGVDLANFTSQSITHNNSISGKIEIVIIDLKTIDTGLDLFVNGVGILSNTDYMEFDFLSSGLPATPGFVATYLTTDGNVPNNVVHSPTINYVFTPYVAYPGGNRIQIIIKENEPVEIWGDILYDQTFQKLKASNGELFKSFQFSSTDNTFEILNRDSYGADGMEGKLTVYYYKDTDSDGIKNSFDNDSDNDGCSDARETGYTLSNTNNFSFNYLNVGTNGLPDSLETSVDNGELVSVSNPTSDPYNDTQKVCP